MEIKPQENYDILANTAYRLGCIEYQSSNIELALDFFIESINQLEYDPQVCSNHIFQLLPELFEFLSKQYLIGVRGQYTAELMDWAIGVLGQITQDSYDLPLDPRETAKIMNDLAYIYTRNNHPNLASEILTQAMSLITDLDQRFPEDDMLLRTIFRALRRRISDIVDNPDRIRKLTKVADYCLTACARNFTFFRIDLSGILVDLASYEVMQKEYELADLHITQVNEILSVINMSDRHLSYSWISEIYSTLSSIESSREHYDMAISYLQTDIEHLENRIKYQFDLSLYLCSLGDKYYQVSELFLLNREYPGRFEALRATENYYLKGLSESDDFAIQTMEILNKLGRLYSTMGDSAMAREKNRQILSLYTDIPEWSKFFFRIDIAHVLHDLGVLEEDASDPARAAGYYQQAIGYLDTLNGKEDPDVIDLYTKISGRLSDIDAGRMQRIE